jgi:hypothetical protein
MIKDTRDQLEQALTDGGVRVMPQGQANPPSVFVIPGTPWVQPNSLGMRRRLVNWGIMCVVSAANEKATIRDTESLAELVTTACLQLVAPWGYPTLNTPGLLVLTGLPYIAFRVDIQTVF